MNNEESSSSNPVNEKNEISNSGRKSEKKGISNGVFTTITICLIIFLLVGLVFYSMYNREHKKLVTLMELEKKSLTEKITDRDSVISEWISTFDQIEKNIALIKEKEKIITISSKDVEISKDKKEQVLEDIKYINSLLDQNKKKIASLNAKLKKSGGTIKILQTKISELEASMKQSEDEISDLKTSLTTKDFKIEQLNVQMADMQTTIEKKEEKIITQTNELNKAFFTSGTFKELKEKGLVTKEGGFIGLGKKESLIRNFSDSSFKQIDITETKTLPVTSKEAKLITDHPAGSYEFVRGTDNKIKALEIKDPKQFWKISKYAVVVLIK